MNEKQNLLKKLRRKQFNTFLEDEEFLSAIIGQALNLEKEFIKEFIQPEELEEYNPYDLITKVTDTRIKIRTSKYNKIIKDIKKNGEYYKKWYDEDTKEYKIKIYLDKIFEEKYKILEKEQKNKIEELFKDEPLTKEDILNLMITELGMKYGDNIKITISGII